MRQVWTLTIPAPCAWLTANIERTRLERSRKVRLWREQTVAACHEARLPHGISPVTIRAVIRYAGSRPPVRDRLNIAPTIKAVVDGLTPARVWTRGGKAYHTPGYGLLPDDSDRHVLDTTWELAPLGPGAQWIGGLVGLTITLDVGSGGACETTPPPPAPTESRMP